MKRISNGYSQASTYSTTIWPFLDDDDPVTDADERLVVEYSDFNHGPCVKFIDPDYRISNSRLIMKEVNQLASALQTAVGEMLHIKYLIKLENKDNV